MRIILLQVRNPLVRRVAYRRLMSLTWGQTILSCISKDSSAQCQPREMPPSPQPAHTETFPHVFICLFPSAETQHLSYNLLVGSWELCLQCQMRQDDWCVRLAANVGCTDGDHNKTQSIDLFGYLRNACSERITWIGYAVRVEQERKAHNPRGKSRVWFEVLKAMSTKMGAFWVVAPCRLVRFYQRFRGPYGLHHQGDEWLIVIMYPPIKFQYTVTDDAETVSLTPFKF
jgi:hypothetical protein